MHSSQKTDREIELQIEFAGRVEKMVFMVDRVRRERFGLEPALGKPYLVNVAHKMKDIAVFALYVKHRAQRRGDFEIGHRTVGVFSFWYLYRRDVRALLQRGDRRVVMVKPDLTGILAKSVFDAPCP